MDVAIPITFMDTPEHVEAKEFSSPTLRCEVAGKPDPEVHWSVGDNPITQGKTMMFQTSLFLLFFFLYNLIFIPYNPIVNLYSYSLIYIIGTFQSFS